MPGEKHLSLEETAIGWLYGAGCQIFSKEVPTANGVADALGVRSKDGKHDVYYIECKASRSDLLSKKQKLVYRRAIGGEEAWCWRHDPNLYVSMFKEKGVDRSEGWRECRDCVGAKKLEQYTGIDFYYILVSDGVQVEDSLYPLFGIIDESGRVIRRARRMPKSPEEDLTKPLIINIAHVLVYKVFGKMYQIKP